MNIFLLIYKFFLLDDVFVRTFVQSIGSIFVSLKPGPVHSADANDLSIFINQLVTFATDITHGSCHCSCWHRIVALSCGEMIN